MGRVKQKVPSNMRKLRRFRSSGHLLFIYAFYSVQWFCQQTLSDPDQSVDAQADIDLRCPHMSDDTFLHSWPILCKMVENVVQKNKVSFDTGIFARSIGNVRSTKFIHMMFLVEFFYSNNMDLIGATNIRASKLSSHAS